MMPLDPRIQEAIVTAVDESGQPTMLSDRLIAWFEAVSSGNASLTDRDSVARYLELLYEATQVDIEPNGDGEH